MKKIAPSERMEQDLMKGLVTDVDPLGEAARRGAQLILQKALEAEVSDFSGRDRYERKAEALVFLPQPKPLPFPVTLAPDGPECDQRYS